MYDANIYDPAQDPQAPENIKQFVKMYGGWEKYITVGTSASQSVKKPSGNEYAPQFMFGPGSYNSTVTPTPLLKTIINSVNKLNQTPLYVASRFASYEIMKILIDAGADVNKGDIIKGNLLANDKILKPLNGLLWNNDHPKNQIQMNN